MFKVGVKIWHYYKNNFVNEYILANEILMNVDTYIKTYFPDGRRVFAARTFAIQQVQQLKEPYEVPNHPPWSKIDKLVIVKVHKGYALLGSVMCNFIDGNAPRWFEIALHPDKNELKIWRDLHCVS